LRIVAVDAARVGRHLTVAGDIITGMIRIPSAILFAILTAAAAGLLQAAGDDDWFDEGRSMQAAAKTLAEGHISHRPLDDKLSREWFDAFFLRLDPQRKYFLASDIEEFAPFAERLDDLAREGNFKFPPLVRRRLQQRAAEAAKTAAAAFGSDHDYTLDESVPRDYETFASTAAERDDRWRLRIKLEMLIEKIHGRQVDEVRTQLSGRYERIVRQWRDMPDERLCTTYLDCLARRFDPHSGFLSNEWSSHFEFVVRFRSYELDIWIRERDGRLVTAVPPGPKRFRENRRFEGWQILAMRPPDGPLIDVVEMEHLDLRRKICHLDGPLGEAETVELELLHPKTLERVTLEVHRSLRRHRD